MRRGSARFPHSSTSTNVRVLSRQRCLPLSRFVTQSLRRSPRARHALEADLDGEPPVIAGTSHRCPGRPVRPEPRRGGSPGSHARPVSADVPGRGRHRGHSNVATTGAWSLVPTPAWTGHATARRASGSLAST